MRWITTLLGSTKARILDLLRRSPASIPELAEQVGVTGNAVRGHVADLQRDGLVRSAGSDPSTGGKPAQLYEITPEAEELYPKAYAPVLRAVIEQLEARDGREATLELLREVGRSVGRRAAARDASAEARVEAAADMLRALGGEMVVTEDDGAWELRGVGCPLSAVVREQPEACALAQALVAEITAGEVTECCERTGERARCGFRVVGSAPSGSPTES